MTPQERAELIGDITDQPQRLTDELKAEAVRQIEAAVAAEREECEQLAWYYAGNIALGDQMKAAEWIAAAIRARSKS